MTVRPRLPFGLPWTRALTGGLWAAAAITFLMFLMLAATDAFVFPYLARAFSDFGAALPARTLVAYELRWKVALAFVGLLPTAFAIPRTRGRDWALITIDVLGAHATAAYCAAFALPLFTLFRLPR